MDHCHPPVTPRPRHPCNMQAPTVHCLTYQFMRSTFAQVCSSPRPRLRSMLMRGYGVVRSNVHVSLVFTASIHWANIPVIMSNVTPGTLNCHRTLTFVFPKDKASHPRLTHASPTPKGVQTYFIRLFHGSASFSYIIRFVR